MLRGPRQDVQSSKTRDESRLFKYVLHFTQAEIFFKRRTNPIFFFTMCNLCPIHPSIQQILLLGLTLIPYLLPLHDGKEEYLNIPHFLRLFHHQIFSLAFTQRVNSKVK